MLLFDALFLLSIVRTLCTEGFDCSSIGGFSFKDKCYRFYGDPKYSVKWKHGRFFCKVLFHPASDLAIITSSEEQKLIEEYMKEKNVPKRQYWLGFLPYKSHDVDDYSDFVLFGIDSTRYEYSNWETPTEKKKKVPRGKRGFIPSFPIRFKFNLCVLMTTNDRQHQIWKQQVCSQLGFPFCEVDLSLTELVIPTLEESFSSVDPIGQEKCEVEENQIVDNSPLIFQIGFNKAGTNSLRRFFSKNDVKACHWGLGRYASTMYKNYLEDKLLMDGMLEDCEFLSDLENHPTIHAYRRFFKILDKQYPKARFILNLRDKENWLKSRKNHNGGVYVEIAAAYHNLTVEEIFEVWSEFYDNHVREVKEHFEGRPDKLLVFDIEKDNTSKLVEFFSDWYDLDEKLWSIHNQTPEGKNKLQYLLEFHLDTSEDTYNV